jgi:hypothetical protein
VSDPSPDQGAFNVYAIGDLHLGQAVDKPMDVFGPEWENHAERIRENWTRTVQPHDVVLLAGDLSWAMDLAEARPDLAFIDRLPGHKYFLRGNHDYWCSSPGKVRAAIGPSVQLVRFDAAVHRGLGICGVRGWTMPGHPEFDPEEDTRYWERERARLDLSLDALARQEHRCAIAMFHYPPRGADGETLLSEPLAQAGVSWCVYGHLHGQDAHLRAYEGEQGGVRYFCVSADYIDFTPRFICRMDSAQDARLH